MAIDVKCLCGARMPIGPGQVGVLYRCSKCGRAYRVTQERWETLVAQDRSREEARTTESDARPATPRVKSESKLTLLAADDGACPGHSEAIAGESAPVSGQVGQSAGLPEPRGGKRSDRSEDPEMPVELSLIEDVPLLGTVRVGPPQRNSETAEPGKLTLTGQQWVTGQLRVVGDARPGSGGAGNGADEVEVIPLADEVKSVVAPAVSSEGVAPSVVVIDNAVDLQYAADERPRVAARAPRPGDEIKAPTRSFWEDLALSFVYPVASAGNAINLCIIVFFVSISVFLNYSRGSLVFFSGAGKLIIYGWMAAVYMSVVTDSAAGSDDMPGIKMESGIFDDIIRPMARYLGSFAMAVLPAIVVAIAIDIGLSLHPLAILGVFVIGVFFWPLMMLLFSVGAIQETVRVDRMIATVLRAPLPYLVIWVMLLLGLAVVILSSVAAAALLDFSGVPKKYFFLSGGGFAMELGVRLLELYLWLVTMRVIGLYYHHYKQKFAFVLE